MDNKLNSYKNRVLLLKDIYNQYNNLKTDSGIKVRNELLTKLKNLNIENIENEIKRDIKIIISKFDTFLRNLIEESDLLLLGDYPFYKISDGKNTTRLDVLDPWYEFNLEDKYLKIKKKDVLPTKIITELRKKSKLKIKSMNMNTFSEILLNNYNILNSINNNPNIVTIKDIFDLTHNALKIKNIDIDVKEYLLQVIEQNILNIELISSRSSKNAILIKRNDRILLYRYLKITQ